MLRKKSSDESSDKLTSACSQEDELADQQPRARCRGKEILTDWGPEECGKHQAGRATGWGGCVSLRRSGSCESQD